MDKSTYTQMNSGRLPPLMIVAALAVIVFSGIGIATMTGVMPGASATSQLNAASVIGPNTRECSSCGVIESIRAIKTKGNGTGVGAVAGDVPGALVGDSIGKGSGRTFATIVGTGGGMYAGNEIEKNVNQNVHYRIHVRMNNGIYRNFYEDATPVWRPGDKVKIIDGSLISVA